MPNYKLKVHSILEHSACKVDYFLQLFLMLVLAYSPNYISIFIPHYNVLSFWQLTNITFSIINDSITCCIN